MVRFQRHPLIHSAVDDLVGCMSMNIVMRAAIKKTETDSSAILQIVDSYCCSLQVFIGCRL